MPARTEFGKVRHASPRDYFERLRAPDHPLTDDEKKIALAEIARRHAWHDKQRREANPSRILTITRVRELERVFADTYGSYLPDDDSGWDDFVIMANHLAHFGGSPERIVARIVEWAAICAPAFPTDKVTDRAKLIAANPLKWKADKLAWRLGLTMERRTRLKIKTIGAVDVKRDDRPAWLGEHHRQRKEAERRAKGVKPRDLANTDSAKKWWEVLGMSRATWYRKGKPMPETEPARETGTADYKDRIRSAVAVSKTARLVQRKASTDSVATLDLQRAGDGAGLGEEAAISCAANPDLLRVGDGSGLVQTMNRESLPSRPALASRRDGFGRVPIDQRWSLPLRVFAAHVKAGSGRKAVFTMDQRGGWATALRGWPQAAPVALAGRITPDGWAA